MLGIILLYAVGLCIYVKLPLPAQLVLTGINSAVPDPIPFVDEIIMYGSIIKKVITAIRMGCFVRENHIPSRVGSALRTVFKVLLFAAIGSVLLVGFALLMDFWDV